MLTAIGAILDFIISLLVVIFCAVVLAIFFITKFIFTKIKNILF